MDSIGTTMVLVTGPDADVRTFRSSLESTAHGRHDFSLSASCPALWKDDDRAYSLELESDGASVHLTLSLPGNLPAFAFAREWSASFPSLAFDSHFWCEASWPDFVKARHVAGKDRFTTGFEVEHEAGFGNPDGSASKVGFYRRTTEREAAMRFSGTLGIWPFLERDQDSCGWRGSDDDDDTRCFLAPGSGSARTVLALRLPGGGTLLEAVDCFGGFSESTWLSVAEIRARYPELVEALEPSAGGFSRPVSPAGRNQDLSARDGEVPF